MSDELTARPAGPGVQTDHKTLAAMQEMGLTVEMDARALRRLVAQIDKVLAAASAPVTTVREECGSDPASLPGQLVTVMQMGTGYFRTARDTIRALFRARTTRLRDLIVREPEDGR